MSATLQRFYRWLRLIARVFTLFYLSAAALSLVVAHVSFVVRPESGLGEHLATPVGKGMEFLDVHWKGVLILVVPFVAPILLEPIPRLRKAGTFEFEPVQLEPVGVREKPSQSPPGAKK